MRILLFFTISFSFISNVVAQNITHEYDNLHRLVKTTYENGAEVTYTYDEVGNRLTRIVSGVKHNNFFSTNHSISSTTIATGDQFDVTFTSNYEGNVNDISYDAGIYLSVDHLYDNQDSLLASIEVVSGLNNTTDEIIISSSINNESSIEGQYILLVLDIGNQVSETNETDNLFAYPIILTSPEHDVYPNLVQILNKNTESISELFLGDSVTFLHQTNYNGTSTMDNVGAIKIAYYLSTDDQFDKNEDFFLDEVTNFVGKDNPYDLITSSFYLENIDIGSYYFFAVCDYQNTLEETDETNNVLGIPITISASLPDLTVEFPSLSTQEIITCTDSLSFSVNVTNNSEVGVNQSFDIHFYHLNTTTWNENQATLVGTKSVPSIAGNETLSVEMDFDISSVDATLGQNFWIIVDYDNVIEEEHEGIVNNSDVNLFNINRPEWKSYLSINQNIDPNLPYSPYYTVKPGDTISGNLFLQNIGISQAFDIKSYLFFGDTTTTDLSQKIEDFTSSKLNGGTFEMIEWNYNLPSDLTDGTYYFTNQINPEGHCVDSISNNIFSKVIKVENPIPNTLSFTNVFSSSYEAGGLPISLNWNTTGQVDLISIELWEVGANNYASVIVDGVQNNGTSLWAIPQSQVSGSYFLKLYGTDVNEAIDSSSVFMITSPTPPDVEFTSIFSSSYTQADQLDLTWNTSTWIDDVPKVSLELWEEGATNYTSLIFDNISNTGSYSWVIPTTVPQGDYFLKLYGTVINLAVDSSQVFTINELVTPSVMFTNNLNGEYEIGETIDFTWTTSGSPDNITINLIQNGSNATNTILNQIPNNGSNAWTIPSSIDIGTGYYFEVIDGQTGSVLATTSTFSITEVVQPSLEFTNSFDTQYTAGQSLDISWNTEGDINLISLQLWEENATNYTSLLINSGNNDGSYSLTLPSNLNAGTYWLKLYGTIVPEAVDSSSLFTIIPEQIPIPDFTISTQDFDFGDVSMLQTDTIFFTIGNTGDGDLNINQVDLNGVYFSLSDLNPSTVNANEVKDYYLIFHPENFGSQDGQIEFSTNDGDFSYPVSGYGLSNLTFVYQDTIAQPNGLAVYPIPVGNSPLFITGIESSGQMQFSLFNTAGNIVLNQIQTVTNGEAILNLGSLLSGFYQLQIHGEDYNVIIGIIK